MTYPHNLLLKPLLDLISQILVGDRKNAPSSHKSLAKEPECMGIRTSANAPTSHPPHHLEHRILDTVSVDPEPFQLSADSTLRQRGLVGVGGGPYFPIGAAQG